MDIILASQSPRRRELMEQIGIRSFRVVASDADERVEGAPSPAAMVEELSLRKAVAVQPLAGEDDIIIAADTVVSLDGRILGKPRDEEDARAMLSALSGRVNTVFTGVTVLRAGRALTQHEETPVTFRTLTPEEIAAYVATGEPMDKAGAYGIQGIGALLISGIRGDYFNVMGLPVYRLGQMLKSFGVDVLKGQP